MKKGDIGTELIFTVKNNSTNQVVDLSTATNAYLIYKYKDIKATKTCSFVEPRTSGKVSYITVQGDIPIGYRYKCEIKVVFSNNKTLTSSTFYMNVDDTVD